MAWVIRTAPLFVTFWLVLSGHFTVQFLVLGAVSITLVCWISRRARLTEGEGASLPVLLRLPRYLPWLGKEVLVAAAAVVRKVWSPRPDLRPAVAVTPSPGMSALSQVIYANSITLTPGTLSLDLDEDEIKIHSLDAGAAEALHEGHMLRRVRELEARR
ncbi:MULTISPECIES: Na+/H+ antiporter subunit E [Amycolatopsis]|uniref:Na+/H+ antiporter subunit E n=1 Tax=Amycolatopsis TaxID=1813 RepID=UPI000B8B7071|nr:MULTISPECIES: Na+/H+ antiporter subunit E [Amycolatopsis]OXM75141.1 cation transporter [Amycolatopsis sp. KNN50.9b]